MRPPENLYHQNIAEDGSRSSCSLNRCNLSPWIIGSEEFQRRMDRVGAAGGDGVASPARRSLTEVLASMPNVGRDEDFNLRNSAG